MAKNIVNVQEAKKVGDEFLALEKYVNLNYLVRPKAQVHYCNPSTHYTYQASMLSQKH